ncbi:MAG: hypothetical protein JKY93_05345, partial [Gammaproteobacteria bacterium]|nr:hypothetical protein [Gammaproteobacteria bacterium]
CIELDLPNTLNAASGDYVMIAIPEKGLINAALMVYFAENQIGFEVMATDAASRTFNILLSEGRDVVAALIL